MILDVLVFFSSSSFSDTRAKAVELLDCIGQVQQGAEIVEWKL